MSCLILLVAGAHRAAGDRILIPVVYTGPGAYGSQWGTEVSTLNRTAVSWAVPGAAFNVACSLPEGCLFDQLPPGVMGSLAAANGGYFSAPAGFILHVPSKDAIGVTVRVGTWPRLFQGRGTTVPVPHESEFTTRPLQFAAYPRDAASARTLLRLYALDADEPVLATIRLISRWDQPQPPFEEHVVVLDGSKDLRYAELSIVPGGSSYIEVVPDLRPDSRAKIWGFVSVADVETNEVTVIPPM